MPARRTRDNLIPRIRTFEVPSLDMWFSDKRGEEEEDWFAALDAIDETAISGWARKLGHREWCDQTPRIRNKIERDFKTFLEANPGADREAFREFGGEVTDPYCHDRRKPTIRLVARARRRNGPIVGGALLMNIDILTDRPRRLGIRYTPVIGLRHPRFSLPRVWGEWGIFTSTNDIPLSDGRALVFEEADLPSTEDTTFAPRPGSELEEMWSRLEGVVDEEANSGEAPTRMRAKRERRPGELEKPIVVRPRTRPGSGPREEPVLEVGDADSPRRPRRS